MIGPPALLLLLLLLQQQLACCAAGASASGSDAPPLVAVAGYTATAGDCGYAVCGTLTSKGEVPHKTMDDIAAICNATAGCEGFNSNGWLKGCLPPHCPAGAKGLEPKAPSNLYTKIDAPKPLPPPAPPVPIPDIDDAFYPTEEQAELGAAAVPLVVSVDASQGSCSLRSPSGATASAAKVGDRVFGNWSVLAFLAADDDAGAASSGVSDKAGVVVMERRWRRWSLLVFAEAGAVTPLAELRKPLGELQHTRTARYDSLTAGEPDYFQKAAADLDDYLGQRIVGDSEHGEASFLKAAKFLPPIAVCQKNAFVRAIVY